MITFPAHKSLAAALSLVLIGGCVAPTTVEEANRQDTAIATTVGALAGALIGAKVAANKDGNRASAAATGAAIGALAGYASGRLIEGVRNDYNQAYTQINQTISETDTRIASMQRDSALAERHIAERRSTIDRLVAQAKAGRQVKQQAQQMLATINQDLATNKAAADEAKVDIRVLEDSIANIDTMMKSNPGDNTLRDGKSKLTQRRDNLIATLNRLNGITPLLVAQQQQLSTISGG